jgi:hypothetical protein
VSCQDEEDDRIEAAIADMGWCRECNTPIGAGNCDGCAAVSAFDLGAEELEVDDR